MVTVLVWFFFCGGDQVRPFEDITEWKGLAADRSHKHGHGRRNQRGPDNGVHALVRTAAGRTKARQAGHHGLRFKDAWYLLCHCQQQYLLHILITSLFGGDTLFRCVWFVCWDGQQPRKKPSRQAAQRLALATSGMCFSIPLRQGINLFWEQAVKCAQKKKKKKKKSAVAKKADFVYGSNDHSST